MTPTAGWTLVKISVPEIRLIPELDIFRPEYGIFSFFFLFHIITHALDRRTAKDDDNRQVDQCHEAHQHVRSTPHKTEFHDGTRQDDQCGDDAEGIEECFSRCASAQGFQPHLCIVEVADQCGEGKQAERDGDKDCSEAAQ